MSWIQRQRPSPPLSKIWKPLWFLLLKRYLHMYVPTQSHTLELLISVNCLSLHVTWHKSHCLCKQTFSKVGESPLELAISPCINHSGWGRKTTCAMIVVALNKFSYLYWHLYLKFVFCDNHFKEFCHQLSYLVDVLDNNWRVKICPKSFRPKVCFVKLISKDNKLISKTWMIDLVLEKREWIQSQWFAI
jgi:hypothetical protein